MYSYFEDEEIKALENNKLTLNSHLFGVNPVRFWESSNISSLFRATAVSYNETGSEFLASFEGKRFPIYGTQFHPEKPYSVFSANSGINHSWESISV